MFKFVLGFASALLLLFLGVNRALKNKTVYDWSVNSASNLVEKVLYKDK